MLERHDIGVREPDLYLGRVAARIINKSRGIDRVTHDITSNPSGTIDWK